MVVGDDDQSIYKFRGAAISNILQFEDKYPNLKKVVLSENYRSNQKILDFAYTSIQNNNPNRLEIKSKINKKIKAQSPGDSESIHIVHSSTIDQEIEYVIDEIKKSKVSLSDIAILCRANNYAKPFIDAFKRENIPYQFLSERGLYNKSEVKDLIALLRIIANPSDNISFFRVLRMDIFNIPMETITSIIAKSREENTSVWSKIKSSDKCSQFVDIISKLIDYSKAHSAGETLFKFTEITDLYEILLKQETIESEEKITNIATFFGKVSEFERNNNEITVIDFINYLTLAEEAGDNPSAKFDVEGIDGVQITTIHGAKGLEFHTVFVTSMVNLRFPTMNRKDPIPVPSNLISEILTEGDFHIEEERRLFYVAVTRAKEKLHLMHSDFYSSTNSKNPRSKKRSRFIDEIIDIVDVTHVEKTTEGVEKFLKPKSFSMSNSNSPLLHKNTEHPEITKFSHSKLSTFERCPRMYEYANILKIPSPMSGAQSFGSSIHNTLNEFYKLVMQAKQASLFEDFQEDLSLKRLLTIFENKWINIGFESKEHMELLKKRGKDILTKFHSHFQERVPDIEFLEKGFKLKIGKYTISGRIDRADILPDGTLEIIDYKTGKSKTQKQVDSDQQLAIYAMATKECFDQPSSKLTLYFLDDDLKVSTLPNEKSLEKTRAKIIEIADKINELDFTPTPSKFKCSFCSYKKICDRAEI